MDVSELQRPRLRHNNLSSFRAAFLLTGEVLKSFKGKRARFEKGAGRLICRAAAHEDQPVGLHPVRGRILVQEEGSGQVGRGREGLVHDA